MKKNVASQSIGAEMITAADGTIFTGTVTVLITIDNGTQSASGGTSPAHEGNGYHSYTPTQAETNGDHVAFTFTGTGAITSTIQVYTAFPQTVDNDTKISLIPTTAMRGTDSAALATALTTAQNDLDIITGATGVNLLTATQASIDAIEADTNDLQTNQGDWLTATGFNTVVPPSVAQFNARTLLAASYFDSSTDSVTVGTNNDKTGYSISGTITTLDGLKNFDPVNDTVANVTLVATTTAVTNELSINVVKINGFTVLGAGTSGNLWRA